MGEEAKRRRRMDEMMEESVRSKKKEMYGKARIKEKEKAEFLQQQRQIDEILAVAHRKKRMEEAMDE